MDKYYTLKETGSSKYTEKMSRFLSFAIPVSTADEAKLLIKEYQNKYHDSRHVCWAYMLGPERKEWQLNDNGEPSGTAGKPILGQINSAGITDSLVIVVRYFGGIKLGTSGLTAAYREAARLAIDDAGIKECRLMERCVVEFSYECADRIMKIIKHPDVNIMRKEFNNICKAEIEYPADMSKEIRGRMSGVEGTMISC
ncbi:MAG: YigZ family protein [Candidatus Amulumruptor caecigallinarius]|nr:YigZ family protein [Candidatus Amulumruptor caecigallinarius]